MARDQATAQSDVDLLVEFSETIGFFEFVELKDFLESILNCEVYLSTKDALKKQFKDEILKGATLVA